jgi:hypothetical protein
MKFLKLWILLVSNVCVLYLFAQRPTATLPIINEATGQITNLADAKSQNVITELNFDDVQGLKNRIPYYRINGSPFWDDKFFPAVIYAADGKIYSAPIRLNLATHEIHFMKDNEEMVLVDMDIDKIILYRDKDSVLFLAGVPDLIFSKKKLEGYVQALNMGKYQLLKYIRRSVASADSLFGTQKKYFFIDEVFYFLKTGEKIERIKKLNKDNIIQFLPLASPDMAWIKKNKIDFKKEGSVILFLDYYNTTHKLQGD